MALVMLIWSLFLRLAPIDPAENDIKRKFQVRLNGVSRSLLLFAFFCGISCSMVYIGSLNEGRDLWRGYVHFLSKTIVLWFVYLTFYWRMASNPKIRMFFSLSFAMFSVIHASYCILQRSYGFDWVHGFSAILPENRLSHGVYRVSGFMSHPLTLGYCQALASVVAIGLALRVSVRREKIAWFIGGAAAVIVVLVSGSRGPQLAIIAGFLVLLPLSIIHIYWKQALALFVIVLILAINLGFFTRFQELFTANLGGDMRATHWAVFWALFRENFAFGIGPGGRDAAISAYYFSVGASDTIKIAHNAFLQVAAEYGALGLIGLGLLIRAWLNLALQTVVIRRVVLSVVIVTLLGALTQNNLQDSEFLLSLTVWLMLLVTIEVESGESSTASRAKTKDSLPRQGVEAT